MRRPEPEDPKAILRRQEEDLKNLRDVLTLYLTKPEKLTLIALLRETDPLSGGLRAHALATALERSEAQSYREAASPGARPPTAAPRALPAPWRGKGKDPALYPDGMPYDPRNCSEAVYPRYSVNGRQCRNRKGHGPHGGFCRQHAKDAKWRYRFIRA